MTVTVRPEDSKNLPTADPSNFMTTEVDMKRLESAVREILLAVGENPDREGLLETPGRVARMYKEIFSGLREDASTHLQKVFESDRHENIVIVKDISFYSVCEHHLVPFHGKVHIAYIPSAGGLVGLSKMARVVETLARWPQIQERLSAQIADLIESELKAKGACVMIEAEHMCMAMRGVRKPNTKTITCVFRGVLETDKRSRGETLKLLKM